jgi:hypothetical protein
MVRFGKFADFRLTLAVSARFFAADARAGPDFCLPYSTTREVRELEVWSGRAPRVIETTGAAVAAVDFAGA